MMQLHATKTKAKPKRKRVRFKGICQDAETLGVHRVSLYRVLSGEWKIPGLLRRYQDLKAKKAAA